MWTHSLKPESFCPVQVYAVPTQAREPSCVPQFATSRVSPWVSHAFLASWGCHASQFFWNSSTAGCGMHPGGNSPEAVAECKRPSQPQRTSGVRGARARRRSLKRRRRRLPAAARSMQAHTLTTLDVRLLWDGRFELGHGRAAVATERPDHVHSRISRLGEGLGRAGLGEPAGWDVEGDAEAAGPRGRAGRVGQAWSGVPGCERGTRARDVHAPARVATVGAG